MLESAALDLGLFSRKATATHSTSLGCVSSPEVCLPSFPQVGLVGLCGALAGRHRHWHAPDRGLSSSFGNTHAPGYSVWLPGGTHVERGRRRGTPASPARSPRSTLVISGVTDVTARSPSHPRSFLFRSKNGSCEGAVKSITFSGLMEM